MRVVYIRNLKTGVIDILYNYIIKVILVLKGILGKINK